MSQRQRIRLSPVNSNEGSDQTNHWTGTVEVTFGSRTEELKEEESAQDTPSHVWYNSIIVRVETISTSLVFTHPGWCAANSITTIQLQDHMVWMDCIAQNTSKLSSGTLLNETLPGVAFSPATRESQRGHLVQDIRLSLRITTSHCITSSLNRNAEVFTKEARRWSLCAMLHGPSQMPP